MVLKLQYLYFIRAQEKENPNFIEENLNDICASVQYSIVNILLNKLKKAAKQYGIKEIAIAGGVSANQWFKEWPCRIWRKQLNWNVYIPAFEYCTDNAAMIAIAGYYKYFNRGICWPGCCSALKNGILNLK